MSVNFEPFRILGADGKRYKGIRPSLIPGPFKYVAVYIGGKPFGPGVPFESDAPQIIGYDAAIRVGINIGVDSMDLAYRIITLMKDGKKWSRLIHPNGRLEERWM